MLAYGASWDSGTKKHDKHHNYHLELIPKSGTNCESYFCSSSRIQVSHYLMSHLLMPSWESCLQCVLLKSCRQDCCHSFILVCRQLQYMSGKGVMSMILAACLSAVTAHSHSSPMVTVRVPFFLHLSQKHREAEAHTHAIIAHNKRNNQ